MSYILEALKQAQDQRDESDSSSPSPRALSLSTPATPDTGRRPAPWLLATLVVALVAGAVAGWWFGGNPEPYPPDLAATDTVVQSRVTPDSQTAEQNAVTPPLAEDVSDSAGEPVQSIGPEPGSDVPTPTGSTIARADRLPEPVTTGVAETTGEGRAVPGVEDSPTEPLAAVGTAIQKDVPAEIKTNKEDEVNTFVDPATAIPDTSGDGPAGIEVAAPGPTGPTPDGGYAPAPAISAPATGDEPGVAGRVGDTEENTEMPVASAPLPHLRQLPLDVQQEIQDLSFSVHLYSPNSANRLVKIDGIVRREGDLVRPGLTLDEITPDGANFTHGAYRFRLPVR